MISHCIHYTTYIVVGVMKMGNIEPRPAIKPMCLEFANQYANHFTTWGH